MVYIENPMKAKTNKQAKNLLEVLSSARPQDTKLKLRYADE